MLARRGLAAYSLRLGKFCISGRRLYLAVLADNNIVGTSVFFFWRTVGNGAKSRNKSTTAITLGMVGHQFATKIRPETGPPSHDETHGRASHVFVASSHFATVFNATSTTG